MKRRTFLSAATGIAASTAFSRFAIGKPGKSANSKLNIAFIGAGCGTHAGAPRILPEELSGEWKANPPAQTFPRVAGGPFREWLRAIKGEGPEPGSNFDYSAKLTEIILLGVLAQRFNTRIEWDAKAGRITNHPELNALVREPTRQGWTYGENLWKQG